MTTIRRSPSGVFEEIAAPVLSQNAEEPVTVVPSQDQTQFCDVAVEFSGRALIHGVVNVAADLAVTPILSTIRGLVVASVNGGPFDPVGLQSIAEGELGAEGFSSLPLPLLATLDVGATPVPVVFRIQVINNGDGAITVNTGTLVAVTGLGSS